MLMTIIFHFVLTHSLTHEFRFFISWVNFIFVYFSCFLLTPSIYIISPRCMFCVKLRSMDDSLKFASLDFLFQYIYRHLKHAHSWHWCVFVLCKCVTSNTRNESDCLGMYLRQRGWALNHEKPQVLSSVFQKWFERDSLWVQVRSVTATAQTTQRCVQCWLQNKHSRYQGTSALNSHGCYLRSLLHETANGEPETVLQRELVLQLLWFLYAWIWIVPFIRADSVTNKTLENCDWITTAKKTTKQTNRLPT
jgi:hypothetical protein